MDPWGVATALQRSRPKVHSRRAMMMRLKRIVCTGVCRLRWTFRIARPLVTWSSFLFCGRVYRPLVSKTSLSVCQARNSPIIRAKVWPTSSTSLCGMSGAFGIWIHPIDDATVIRYMPFALWKRGCGKGRGGKKFQIHTNVDCVVLYEMKWRRWSEFDTQKNGDQKCRLGVVMLRQGLAGRLQEQRSEEIEEACVSGCTMFIQPLIITRLLCIKSAASSLSLYSLTGIKRGKRGRKSGQ